MHKALLKITTASRIVKEHLVFTLVPNFLELRNNDGKSQTHICRGCYLIRRFDKNKQEDRPGFRSRRCRAIPFILELHANINRLSFR